MMIPDPLLCYRAEFPILEAFAALDEIRESGSWRRWRGEPVAVT